MCIRDSIQIAAAILQVKNTPKSIIKGIKCLTIPKISNPKLINPITDNVIEEMCIRDSSSAERESALRHYPIELFKIFCFY